MSGRKEWRLAGCVLFLLAALVPLSLQGQWPNHRKANAVLGQPDFTGSRILPPTPSTLNTTKGFDMDAEGRIWVADSAIDRVLRFEIASALPTHPLP